MSKKIIINCAVTGAIHVPTMSRYLPITPEQIAREAIAAARAMIGAMWLSASPPEGAPTMTPEERMVTVRSLKPELASINMGSINFGLYPMMAKINQFQFDWEKPYLESTLP